MATSRERHPLLQQIVTDYTHIFEHTDGRENSTARTLRERGLQELLRLGIPTIRHEEWKYTNLYQLLAKSFTTVVGSSTNQVEKTYIDECRQWGEPCVLLNGERWSKAERPAYVKSLAEALQAKSLHADAIGTLATIENNPMVAWNSAFLYDGACIEIPQDVHLSVPIVLLSILAAHEQPTLSHERHIVRLNRNAQAQLIFIHRTQGDAETLLNQVVETWLEENSELEVIILQNGPPTSHIITTHEYHLARNSHLRMITISIGGGFIRNMPAARLAGEGSDVQLYGFTYASGTSLIDHHTVVDHRIPHCTSNQLYKAILDDKASGVFNGKICVHPNAQKTSAYQANKNIVLSSRATINTKPQLEIFANDVRCTHGCTVGRLDQEAMFYLCSRGLSKEQAEALLLTAFAEEITAAIANDRLRSDVNATIEHILHADELQ